MNETELERLIIRLVGDAKPLEGPFRQAEGMVRNLDRTVGGIGASVGQVKAQLSSLGGTVQGVMGSLAAGVGIGGALGAVHTAVKGAMDREDIGIAFESLVGNAEKSKEVLASLYKFAADTPFEFPQIANAAKQMLAFGSNADNIVPTMKKLGDVASALDINLGELTYVFGTLQSQGRAYTQDINQFATRGIPIWQELAKVLKLPATAVDQVRAAVEAGRVGFAQVDQAFANMTGQGGRYFNMMERRSQTLSGIFSTLRDNIGQVMADVGAEIIKGLGLKEAVLVVGEFAGFLGKQFKEMDPDLKTMLMSFAGAAAAIGVVVAGVLFLAPMVGAIVGFIGPWAPLILLAAGAVTLLVKEVGGIGAAWKLVSDGAKQFWEWSQPIREAFVMVFDALKKAGTEWWKTIKEAAAGVWKSIVGDTKVNWDEVRTTVVRSLFAVEYALLHLGPTADVVWKGVKYYAVYALNSILENLVAFVGGVGGGGVAGTFAVMGTNWKDLMNYMLALSGGAFASMILMWKQYPDQMRKAITGGTTNVEIAKSLTEDLKLSESGLSIVSTRMKQLEEQFRKEWQQAKGTYLESMQEYIDRRMRELTGRDKGADPVQALADDLKKGNQSLMKEAHELDAVGVYSAEAIRRVYRQRQEFRYASDPVLAARGAVTGGGPGAANAAPVPNAASVFSPNGIMEKQEQTNKLLDDMKEILKSRPTGLVVAKDANLGV